MHAAILCVAFYLAQLFAAPADSSVDPTPGIQTVEQEVELISVAHVGDGAELVFFWAPVQGEITCLDHRWLSREMIVVFAGGCWTLAWLDSNGDSCYRIVRSRHWAESWERESPLAEQNQRPWFRQLCAPGLAMPRRAER